MNTHKKNLLVIELLISVLIKLWNTSLNILLGTCAVIVTNNGKDRSLCANLSAAQTFTVDHLDVPENKTIIENAKFFLVTVSFQDT